MKKYTTADRLKHIMKTYNLRQVDILEKCKPFCEQFNVRLGRNDLSQYVSGKVEPGQEKLTVLAKALNVSEAWLMGLDVSPTNDNERLSNIIDAQINAIGLSLDQVSNESGAPLMWLKEIDSFVPGEMEFMLDDGKGHELDWNDTIGGYKSYELITKVAEVIGLPGSMLRSALARQEIPAYDGPTASSEEDFKCLNLRTFVQKSNSHTIESDPNYLGGYETKSLKRIPILGNISAGLPLYAEEQVEGYTYTNLNGGAEYFGLKVKGDSMNAARICDGDVIIVRKQPCVENGQIAVVMVDGENATVKKFFRDKDTVTLVPVSTNPEHLPQFYNLKTTEIKVLGRVIKNEIAF